MLAGEAYSPAEMCEMLAGAADDLDESSVELLYLYRAAVTQSDPAWELSLDEIFAYLADDLVNDTRFDALLGDDFKDEIADMRAQLSDAIEQMKGAHYSILSFTTNYPEESDETTAFLAALTDYADAHLSGDYYLIGSSPMVYEMQQSFAGEMRLITMLTAIAIFLVVLFTFRSLLIPLLLVLVVQCGVYLTISTCELIGYHIYYLAMLIVQCILMGATIDYGILFTNCYREARRSCTPREACASAYKTASHTIFTSGLIMIIVTAVIALSPADPTIGQICMTVSIGTAAAVLLISFVLPGLLMAFDRFVVKRGTPRA